MFTKTKPKGTLKAILQTEERTKHSPGFGKKTAEDIINKIQTMTKRLERWLRG